MSSNLYEKHISKRLETQISELYRSWKSSQLNYNNWFEMSKSHPQLSESDIDLLLQYEGVSPLIYTRNDFIFPQKYIISVDDQRDMWQYQKDRKIFKN